MELYERDMWTNKGFSHLFNKEIFEYDIQSAGLNLAIKYRLLPNEVCKHLKGLPKEKRVVEMGLMEKDNMDFRNALKKAFIDIRRMFFESNGLETYDVISIKKDAIFTTRRCPFAEFDNVFFKIKNEYTSFMQFSKLEFYYNREKIDVKGMNPCELQFHQDYMMSKIITFMHMYETSYPRTAVRMMRSFIDDYKRLELEPEYYREFRPGGRYRLKDQNDTTEYPVFPKERLEELDISYNYLNILMKMALIAV